MEERGPQPSIQPNGTLLFHNLFHGVQRASVQQIFRLRRKPRPNQVEWVRDCTRHHPRRATSHQPPRNRLRVGFRRERDAGVVHVVTLIFLRSTVFNIAYAVHELVLPELVHLLIRPKIRRRVRYPVKNRNAIPGPQAQHSLRPHDVLQPSENRGTRALLRVLVDGRDAPHLLQDRQPGERGGAGFGNCPSQTPAHKQLGRFVRVTVDPGGPGGCHGRGPLEEFLHEFGRVIAFTRLLRRPSRAFHLPSRAQLRQTVSCCRCMCQGWSENEESYSVVLGHTPRQKASQQYLDASQPMTLRPSVDDPWKIKPPRLTR